jgi:hypothetical protein
VTVFFALLVPLAGLLLGLGCLFGGRVGHVLVIAGTVLFGVAAVLVLAEA